MEFWLLMVIHSTAFYVLSHYITTKFTNKRQQLVEAPAASIRNDSVVTHTLQSEDCV